MQMMSPKKIFCQDNNPGLFANRSIVAGRWLKQALGTDGYSMSDGKRESLIVTHGKGSKFVGRENFVEKSWPESKAVQVLRVLGGQINSFLSLGPELRHRFQAGRVGCFMMGKIWFYSVPFSIRRLCFQSIVDGNLYSGLTLRLLAELTTIDLISFGSLFCEK